ncbi:hypothetical protein AAHH59_10730, partial [Pediococcus acidilactici]|uniref:hypothetical protein n=1 Tax=Pediococcus acidilactici TaxID=1254 RepID=UPI00318A7AEA
MAKKIGLRTGTGYEKVDSVYQTEQLQRQTPAQSVYIVDKHNNLWSLLLGTAKCCDRNAHIFASTE